MRRIILLLACLVLVFFVQPVLADETVLIKAGYQLLQPSGQFSGTQNGVGTVIDLESDMNFDDSEDITLEAALQLGNFRLSAGYLPIKTEGRGVGLDLSFNGQPFTGTVDGKIDADIYDIALNYYLVNMNDSPSRFQLGLEVAAKIIDADLSVTGVAGTGAGITESVSGVVAIPTVGGRLRLAMGDFFGVVGRVGYMEYSGDRFLDAEAQIEFSPLPLVGLYGGYRYLDIEIDESDVLFDVQFSGPFAGVLVRF